MANGGIIGPVNITSRGKNTVSTKTSSTPSAVTTQPGTRLVDFLVVAGGGGGGHAGGGGAGGFRKFECQPTSGNSALGAVTIGAGGAGRDMSPCVNGADGNNSSFVLGCTTYTSEGGGRGAAAAVYVAGPGGSGGGGPGQAYGGPGAKGCGNTPPTTPPQGSDGGSTAGNPGTNTGGAGGGGSGGFGGFEPPIHILILFIYL